MKNKNKVNTKLFTFHTGTHGMRKHRDFIKMVNKKGFKIVNAFTKYNSGIHSHRPEYLFYVIEY